MSASKVTTDRAEIRKWVEARGGKPAHIKRTGRSRDPGILRIDYPGFADEEALESLSWDDWFRAFDAHDLAFVYQEAVKGGQKSRFSKLVARDSVATGRRGSAAKSTATKSGTRVRSAARRSAAKRSTAKRSTAKRSAAKRSTVKREAPTRSATRSIAKKSGAAKRTTKRPSTGRMTPTARTTRTTRKTSRAAPGRMSKQPAKKAKKPR